MFVLSKLFWLMAAPGNAVVILLTIALFLLPWRPRAGFRLMIWAGVVLAALTFLPIGALLLRPLEERFPQPPGDAPAPTGAIVLGGSTDQIISAARQQPTIAGAATRITSAVALTRRFPEMRLVFTGGSGALILQAGTEAEVTDHIFTSLGVAPDRITLEQQSRNTFENAVYTRRLIDPKPGERWLLVTSAYHMPRAVALFRAAGFPVVPYPVDYQTAGTATDLLPSNDLSKGLRTVDTAAKEWIGLLVYRLTGRITTIFPEPD